MQVEDYAEADRREVNPPIEVESARGRRAARSTGGSENDESGSDGYEVQTDIRGGSKLLIFGPKSANSEACHWPSSLAATTLTFVPVRKR